MIELLCIGHVCRDIILPLQEFPVENTKYVFNEFLESPGGPACNAANLLGYWEASVAFAGLLGDDEAGFQIRRELSAWGIDVSLTESRPDHPTPMSFIIANKTTGSRTIFNRKRSAAYLHCPRETLLRTFPPPGPRVLLFDGHEPETSLAAIQAWPDALTVLDAGSLRPGTETLSEIVDFCVASERFAREIAGLSPAPASKAPEELEAVFKAVARRGATHSAVTLGERGCLYTKGNRVLHLPALPALAVDTTAAGDIFHGAFAYGIFQGRDFENSLKLASAAAGLSVERPGGRDSIPRLEKVLGTLENWNPKPEEISDFFHIEKSPLK